MGLKEYRRKRDFARTREPAGNGQTAPGHRFVVQKHAASRLHFDFRLELDGVLKSWAVPKGPSLDPLVKTLAVRVEDHPLDYAEFEGIIPRGQYGGGTVMVWDHGQWQPVGDGRDGLRKGKFHFHLLGERLRGEWLLVQMHGPAGAAGKNWLLRKIDDQFARRADEHRLVSTTKTSVLTGRSMAVIAEQADRVWSSQRNGEKSHQRLDAAALNGSRKRSPPRHLAPQLATLAEEVPAGDAWIHELKLDGYRLLAFKEGSKIQLRTRRGQTWSRRFPTIVAALQRLPVENGIFDGEVVVLESDGTSNFQALQHSMQAGRAGAHLFCLFDLPYCQGHDLRHVPLLERKQFLAQVVLPADGPLRYNDHTRGQGPEFFEQACRHAVEGIVSKRADSTYESRRTRTWIKVKCLRRQEFVIGGWTEPSGSRSGIGALLLGFYEGGDLRFCGKVGTGFTEASLQELPAQLDKVKTDGTPFSNPPRGYRARGVHWVEPKLVAQVAFAQWTNDSRLRHASFEGLREDKPAHEVTREQPMDKTMKAATPRDKEQFAGVRLSHPDRVLYPESSITKRDLARYYQQIADWVLPHVVDRPLMLLRCPQGTTGQCFYQKHANASVPDAIDNVAVREREGKKNYLMIRDLKGLISLVQLGVLELHPWGARADDVDSPDRIVFDLDPAPDVTWSQLVQAAHTLHTYLEGLGLRSFARTTGGKGIHVVLPIVRRNTWAEVKDFARRIADHFVAVDPERFIATASKARRKHKIFIDYLRNDRGSTAIAGYSSRARAGAPVATPVSWEELTAKLDPQKFTVATMPARLVKLPHDPWDDFLETRQSITAAIAKRVQKAR